MNEKRKLDKIIEKEAEQLILSIAAFDAEMKPGAFIKRWGKRFPHLKDMKSEHFQNVRRKDWGNDETTSQLLEKLFKEEKERKNGSRIK